MLGKSRQTAAARGDGSQSVSVIHATEAVSVRTLVYASLIVAALVGLVLMIAQIISIVLLLLIAIVFAEGIRTPVKYFGLFHLNQPAAVLAVYLCLVLILGVLVALLVAPIVNEVNNLINQLPGYQERVGATITQLQQQLHIAPNQNLTSQVVGSLNTAKDVLVAVGSYVAGVVVDFFLVMILSFLWLVTSDRLKEFVVDLFQPQQQPLASDILREMGFRMGGYVSATGINMVIVGVATGVASAGLRLPSPVLLGIFAGLAAAVPLVGPIVGSIPAVLLGFTVGPAYPLIVALVMAGVQMLDAQLIVPPLMNRVVALPALSVVLALLIGGTLAGIIGALLSIPVAAALHVLVTRVLVPAIHHRQGRDDEAFARAATPVSPALKPDRPTGGGRRKSTR